MIRLMPLALLALLLPAVPAAADPVPYDIVYVRQPRAGNLTNTIWPEVFHPARAEPGADLMLLHPDGGEEILVDCTVCSVTDPFVSFDGEWVYYSLFHDLTRLNGQRRDLPLDGADIYRLHLRDRTVERLTQGEHLAAGPVEEIRLGIADASSGIDLPTLRVTSDFPVAGRAPGAELADLAVEVGDGIYSIPLGAALGPLVEANVRVEISDRQGNVTRVDRRFATVAAVLFADGFESGNLSAWDP